MTISTTTSKVTYTGDGATVAFPVTFVFFGTTTTAELEVIETVIATGVETTKTNGTDFTVSGGNGSTGTVTATTAPASTVTWTINRTTTQTQETDYVENDPFPAEAHEAALDRLTAIAQEQETEIGTAFRYPVSYTGGASSVVPTPVADKFLGWNSGATALENKTVSDASALVTSAFIDTLLDDSDQATAQATLGVVPGTDVNTHMDTVSQAEAEAGTATTRRAWTAQRVAQAIAALAAPAASIPSGSVTWFAANSPPSGWLECDGSAVSRTTYSDLFTAIGTTFGVGDGSTTFNLPDLRGEFVRGWDNGKGTDSGRSFGSAQSDQNKAHTHTGTTASNGSHSHTIDTGNDNLSGTGVGYPNTATGTTSTNSAGAHTHTFTTDSDGGTEARPRNIALMAIIKY